MTGEVIYCDRRSGRRRKRTVIAEDELGLLSKALSKCTDRYYLVHITAYDGNFKCLWLGDIPIWRHVAA